MKKLFSLLPIALLMMTLLACGCIFGDDDDDPAETTPTPPTIVDFLPADGAEQIDTYPEIVVWFSETMDEASVEAATSLDAVSRVDAPLEFYWTGNRVIISVVSELDNNMDCTLTIAAGALDAQGDELAADFTLGFTTETTWPGVESTYPLDGATDVTLDIAPMIDFSETMDPTTTITAVSVDPLTAFTATLDWDVLSIEFVGNLVPNTLYTITIDESAESADAEPMAADYVFTFTTGNSVDTTAPTIVSFSPANGATGVSTSLDEIVITFSEPLGDYEWEGVDQRIVNNSPMGPVLTSNNTVMRISFNGLAPGCTYYLNLLSIQDPVGNVNGDIPPYIFSTEGTASYFPHGANDWWFQSMYDVDDDWWDYALIKVDGISGNSFNLVKWIEPGGREDPPTGFTYLDEIEHFSLSGDDVYYDGWDERDGPTDWTYFDMDPGMLWLPQPIQLGETWTVDSSSDMGEGMYFRVVADAELADIDDFVDMGPILRGAPESLGWGSGGNRADYSLWAFPDCAIVEIDYTVYIGDGMEWEIIRTGTMANWYCAGVGLVFSEENGRDYEGGVPGDMETEVTYRIWYSTYE